MIDWVDSLNTYLTISNETIKEKTEYIDNFESSLKFENMIRIREPHSKEVKESNNAIISLKQRCTKLQYESKQGKQNKKKKNVKVKYNILSESDKKLYDYMKNILDIFGKERN